MLFNEIFNNPTRNSSFNVIKERCTDFIVESQGIPLFKSLPASYKDVHKVKIRKRNPQNRSLTESFNDAFREEQYNLRERALFANGQKSFIQRQNEDKFYVFPIDGYQFMYCTEIQNSNNDHKAVIDALHEEFGHEKGNKIIADLIKFSYTSNNLVEGLETGAEIIIYNIPFFYAVRETLIPDYEEFIHNLKG